MSDVIKTRFWDNKGYIRTAPNVKGERVYAKAGYEYRNFVRMICLNCTKKECKGSCNLVGGKDAKYK